MAEDSTTKKLPTREEYFYGEIGNTLDRLSDGDRTESLGKPVKDVQELEPLYHRVTMQYKSCTPNDLALVKQAFPARSLEEERTDLLRRVVEGIEALRDQHGGTAQSADPREETPQDTDEGGSSGGDPSTGGRPLSSSGSGQRSETVPTCGTKDTPGSLAIWRLAMGFKHAKSTNTITAKTIADTASELQIIASELRQGWTPKASDCDRLDNTTNTACALGVLPDLCSLVEDRCYEAFYREIQ